jgi:uncharacterized protein
VTPRETVVRIGLISDTHGLLRPEVLTVFNGVEHIFHAGDVGGTTILTELEAIAPVTAVWGNTDFGLHDVLPEIISLEVGGIKVKVLHGHQSGSPRAQQMAMEHRDCDLVLFGHSHKPEIHRAGSVLAVNPGSAGPARFSSPVTVAIGTIRSGNVGAEIVELIKKR